MTRSARRLRVACGVVAAVVAAAWIALSIATNPGAGADGAALETPRPTVVLLHGLWRSAWSMSVLEETLLARGFRVVNYDYPSTRRPFDELVAGLADELRRCCPADDAPLHFVTHSLGGILVRGHLANTRPPNLGRVVMLAPPNGGSELVDLVGEGWLVEFVLGPTGSDLGTAPDSVPNRLPLVDFELGVITGDGGLDAVGAFPGASDGTVSVESARVSGMKDFLVVDEDHTFIMRDPEVVEQVLYFLEHGRFSRPEE